MFVDDHMCGQIKFVEGRKAYSFDCGRRNASEVSVRLSSGWLQVCEIEVLGKYFRCKANWMQLDIWMFVNTFPAIDFANTSKSFI